MRIAVAADGRMGGEASDEADDAANVEHLGAIEREG
jgi:hypothetical protein